MADGLPPLLIPLAHGLSVGGVTTWAVRLVNGLAARGHAAGLLLHQEPAGCAVLDVPLHPDVRVFRPAALPPLGERPGDLSSYIPSYRDAVRALAGAAGGRPVAIAPTMHGDSFGTAAALALAEPESVRILGWQHSDIEYDARVLARYEPCLSAFVAVSNRVEATLRARLPGRATDIHNIACGVEVGLSPPLRRASGPLRLIYTGRIEHQQKRIIALVYMSQALSRRGIEHTLTAVGDGPASPAFDALAAANPRIRRLPPQSPARIAALLAESDAFVLPSRYEGLSVSMLEAMAAGCVAVLAKTESGALQAVEPGYNGLIADVSPEADEPAAGLAMADAVERLLSRDRAAMAAAAWRTVLERFSLERHVSAAETLLATVAGAPPRSWPADRPCAFTAAPGSVEGSGSVPSDGPARLAALLKTLAGRRIILHGAGQHTIQLAPTLADSPATIVAIADDDRQRCGTHLWGYPILAPSNAGATGANDVVISSWMHQDAIYARRHIYESQGLRVHRIYEP